MFLLHDDYHVELPEGATMQRAKRIHEDAGLPKMASLCEFCPMQWDCRVALEHRYQVPSCVIVLPDDLGEALETILAERIARIVSISL